jgi:hypothetical protein
MKVIYLLIFFPNGLILMTNPCPFVMVLDLPPNLIYLLLHRMEKQHSSNILAKQLLTLPMPDSASLIANRVRKRLGFDPFDMAGTSQMSFC